MKRTIIVILSIILLIFSSGCKGENSKLSDNFSYPVQKPPAQSFTQRGDTIYCKGIDRNGFKSYQDILKTDGWEAVFASGVDYTYTKNNDTLDIIDQSFLKEDPEIRISFMPGYSGPERENALTKEEASKLIQEYIKSYAKVISIKTLVERTVPDAFEKMRLQIFRVYGTGETGTFLICNKKVLHAFDSFENAYVVDIDKDGKYELISLWGFGSGIYRIQLTAYKFGNPPYYNSLNENLYVAYSNCWIPDKGYAVLRLKKLNDTDVELCLTQFINNDYKIIKSYGKLRIYDSALVPSAKYFPFKTWDEYMK